MTEVRSEGTASVAEAEDGRDCLDDRGSGRTPDGFDDLIEDTSSSWAQHSWIITRCLTSRVLFSRNVGQC